MSKSCSAYKRTSFRSCSGEEIAGADAAELLDMLDNGEADIAIIKSTDFASQRSLYPQLKVAFDLVPDGDEEMVWYLAPGADNARLQAYIDQFFLRLQEDGTLERLRTPYFRHSEGFPARVPAFNLNMRTTLPQYKKLIQQVARSTSWNGNCWRPSPTRNRTGIRRPPRPAGARGLMMLTQSTANEIGVTDRLDPLQSLRGGSRYLKKLRRARPRASPGPIAPGSPSRPIISASVTWRTRGCSPSARAAIRTAGTMWRNARRCCRNVHITRTPATATPPAG